MDRHNPDDHKKSMNLKEILAEVKDSGADYNESYGMGSQHIPTSNLMVTDNIPEYEVAEGRIFRDGQEVRQDSIVKDYDFLKTEIKRLEKLSQTLYRDNVKYSESINKSGMEFANTLEVEARKRKKQLFFIIFILSLSLVGGIISALIFYLKEQREINILKENKEIKALVSQNEAEKLRLLKAAQEKFELEKNKLVNELKSKREEEMTKLKQDLQKESQAGLSPEQKKELEKKLAQRYEQKMSQQVNKLSEAIKLERQKLEKKEREIQQLSKRLKEEKQPQQTVKTETLEEILTNNLSSMQQQFQQMQKEIKELRHELVTTPVEKQKISASPTAIPFTAVKPNPTPTPAPTPSPVITRTGRQIMEEHYQQVTAKTEQVECKVLSDNSEYYARIYSKQYFDTNTVKELMKFYKPSRYKGDAFLRITNKKTYEGDAWARDNRDKRVYRIPHNQRNERILQTEFTFEDWMCENLNTHEYTYLKTVVFYGRNAHIIMSVPKTKKELELSQYSKKYFWMDAESYITLQVRYYDKKGKLVKVYAVKNVHEVAPGFWRPDFAMIGNLISRRKTRLYFRDYIINKPIADEIFTLRAMDD